MSHLSISATPKPIKFGTDGWRGVIAADFTFERVMRVAPLAARVLAETYGAETGSHSIVVGYDRRFLAEHFARAAAEAICEAGFAVELSSTYAPTPVFSWIAHHRNALGAIVLTASHNPGPYLGLKVKGAFGGSVGGDVTQRIEALLAEGPPPPGRAGSLALLDPWTTGYCEDLRSHVAIEDIRAAIADGRLAVFADAMHGAAAGGLEKVLGVPVRELNGDRDPLFEGGAPEPLPKYIAKLFAALGEYRRQPDAQLAIGFVFDGDCDRIAAVDGRGEFMSSQRLIPVLIEHLATRRGRTGEIVKTVSGSDLIPKVAALYDLELHETAVGFKYIADRMLSQPVLLGGEESGGIGYGNHVPERDALLSALYVMEAIVESGQDAGDLYAQLQEKTQFASAYDRVDLPLASMEARDRLLAQLEGSPPETIAGQGVKSCQTTDGYKFRLEDGRWLMVRFSGTEPVLRLYCEADSLQAVKETLAWAKTWAESAS